MSQYTHNHGHPSYDHHGTEETSRNNALAVHRDHLAAARGEQRRLARAVSGSQPWASLSLYDRDKLDTARAELHAIDAKIDELLA